jgi:hypothetical protein
MQSGTGQMAYRQRGIINCTTRSLPGKDSVRAAAIQIRDNSSARPPPFDTIPGRKIAKCGCVPGPGTRRRAHQETGRCYSVRGTGSGLSFKSSIQQPLGRCGALLLWGMFLFRYRSIFRQNASCFSLWLSVGSLTSTKKNRFFLSITKRSGGCGCD